MSRTIRICPRRYIKIREGQTRYKCKCDWCVSPSKRKAIDKVHKKEIQDYSSIG